MMHNYNRFFYLLLAFNAVCVFNLKAQSGGCGTQVSAVQKTLETSFTLSEGNATNSLPQLRKTLSFHVFIVKDNKYQTGLSNTDIQNAITNLNKYFTPIDLKFKICNTTEIDNYQFDNLEINGNEKDLTAQFFEKNIINLYLVTSLKDEFGQLVSGFTYMPADLKNSIFIKKDGLAGMSLIHQMGHFLNLYHTHESAFGGELVNRTNCTTAGDRCCDTEADPGLEGMADKSCVYTGKSKDSSGTFYHPRPDNFMSFSNDSCRCVFSRTQFLRMVYALQNFRKDLR